MVNVKRISKILIIVLFVILSIFVANNHEHWSDEAQSYLLARDNSILEIFSYMRYEGTPSLWVIVIKLFIFLGGTFETFYIIPIFFSTIGIIIFEYKIKAPWYIKVLFPFTYFIFYQYTIVARSYCMVFPMLMIIAFIYDKKLEKPILYSLILLFFMNISLHTLIISGSLYLIFLIDVYKNKKFGDKKVLIACILIFIELLLTLICTIPAIDCSFVGNGGREITHIISEATIGSDYDILIECIITAIIATIFIFVLKNQRKLNNFYFIILFVPVIAVLMFITYQGWHIGIIWILIFTYFIINNMINDSKIIKIFMIIVCLIQIYWTISSCIYDFYNNYSASKDASDFLKTIDYEEKRIYGLGYSVTGIQPYFEYNIFENQNTDKSFYLWKINNGYLSNNETLSNKADIYVISEFHKTIYYKHINELEKIGYRKYEFKGYTYIKNHKYEPEGYIIYVK